MTDLLDLIAARERRDTGISLVEGSERSQWMRTAEECIDEIAEQGWEFSSDTVCEFVGRPTHPCAVGALLMRAVRSGKLERTGSVQSTRVLARGRWLPLYRGVRP